MAPFWGSGIALRRSCICAKVTSFGSFISPLISPLISPSCTHITPGYICLSGRHYIVPQSDLINERIPPSPRLIIFRPPHLFRLLCLHLLCPVNSHASIISVKDVTAEYLPCTAWTLLCLQAVFVRMRWADFLMRGAVFPYRMLSAVPFCFLRTMVSPGVFPQRRHGDRMGL